MRLDVTEIGADKIRGDLSRLAERGRDPRPALAEILGIIRGANKRQFQTGKGWRRLDADTLRNKKRKGQTRGVLRATGALERALTEPNAPGSFTRVRYNTLVFGLSGRGSVFYGAFHDKGKGVPRRRLTLLRKPDRDRSKDVLRTFLLTGVAR